MKTIRYLLLCLLVTGCIPVPTPPHGIGVVIDEKAFKALLPGEATRADLLLTLGTPQYRLAEDHFLLYEWDVAYGYVIVGGYTQAYPIPVTAPHYVCFEFADDGLLIRRDTFTGGLYAKPDKAIERCMHPQPEGK